MNIMDTTAISEISYSELAHFETRSGKSLVEEIRFELIDEPETIRNDWQTLEAEVSSTPFQTYAWTQAWRSHVGRLANIRPAIVVGRDDAGSIQILLPLALHKQGPVTILEWLAGDHASYTGGLFRKPLLDQLSRSDFLTLWSKITDLLPPFDIVQFMAQLPTLNGQVNPTTHFGAKTSASPYFCITIDAEWETLHHQRRSSKTRRSERQRERKLGDIGPLSFAAHYEGRELAQATEVLFEQRSARFAEQGIHDFLGDPGMADFYRSLTKMTRHSHGIEGFVSTLSVGGTMVAGLLNLIYKNKNYALVSSMTTDETMRKYSPGEILMRNTLRHCCEKGLEAYDCGGGNDVYKNSWSDKKFHILDTVSPQTMLGSAYAGSYNSFLAAKSRIKQTPALWKTFKVLRKLGFWS